MSSGQETAVRSPETELTWALINYALSQRHRSKRIGRKMIRKILRKLGAEGLDAETVLHLSRLQAD
ncbi:GNAT family N-acetyltransferase [Ancylobacter sp. G4_0304]|uniref:GNAT family N-acetyltransferase n=1 Tax=Ancylobacter sp. G4_0304 TaxID=3114289 RepID=UPI0039C6AC59